MADEAKIREFLKIKNKPMSDACVEGGCQRWKVWSVGSDIHMIECPKHAFKEMFFIPANVTNKT